MKSTLKLLPMLAAASLVPTASSVFAGTIHLEDAGYSIEVSSLLKPNPTVTVSSDGLGIDVQNAFAAQGVNGANFYLGDTFTFRILPDAGRELALNGAWTAISGGGYVAPSGSQLWAHGTTSPLSGTPESTFRDKYYTHNWFNSYGFSYQQWDSITPFSEGFVLEWEFLFAAYDSPGSSASVGSIHVQAATIPASTIPDQPATLLLLGFALIALARVRRLVAR